MDNSASPFDQEWLAVLGRAVERLEAGFRDLPPHAGRKPEASIEGVLLDVAGRLADNYPYFHPLYAGQMLKPPHPVARLAYMLALILNPNNHALDGGRASSAMEKEAVAGLARLFGWEAHLGHLASGGTMANLEALWVAGCIVPGGRVLASEQAHYTQRRISGVLRLPFEAVPCDRFGRMDVEVLARLVGTGPVAAVVATIGTTSVGSVDPLPQILALRDRHRFRLHADAAYGGYFRLADNLSPETRSTYEALGQADSIVVDPHKHGLQPYGCGCVLFRDPSVGRFYKHDSPYTYFSSQELHLGEISLECSRPGAAAVALWATQRLLPLERGGTFAGMLADGRAAALDLHGRIASDARFVTPFPPELDIVVWAVRDKSASAASRRARRLFDAAARRDLHLALAELPVDLFAAAGSASPGTAQPGLSLSGMTRDRDTITCLRSVLMKAEHKQWLPEIWSRLDAAAADAATMEAAAGERRERRGR